MYLSTFVIVFIVGSFVDATSRQKRCIVIQKQSGTHGDSSEGADGSAEDRKPIPARRPLNRPNNEDIELITPLPVKIARTRATSPPNKRPRRKFNPLRNRF